MSINPPATGCYHCAFTPSGQTTFVNQAGKGIAVQMFYASWSSAADFPARQCSAIIEIGSLPHLTWEPWDYNINGTTYSLQSIINGTHDAYIRRWAQQIRDWGQPLFLRWGHEMNGNWYPWDGTHNGGATTTGYGDPGKADGPERYVDAWRHIHDIFSETGADNVTWIWAPNVMWDPQSSLNAIRNFYPGDAYVDWLGIEGYNWGSQQSWQSFDQIYNVSYDSCLALADKPIMIPEFASAESGGDKAAWISDAFAAIRTRYPAIKAITWFDINKETDWRINSSETALAAYRTALSDEYFLDKVVAPAPVVPRGTVRTRSTIRLQTGSRGVRLEAAGTDVWRGPIELYRPDGRRVAVLRPVLAGLKTVWQSEGVLPTGLLVARGPGAQPGMLVRIVK
jgi:beta-mannanase